MFSITPQKTIVLCILSLFIILLNSPFVASTMNHPRSDQQQQQQHNPLEKLQAALASLRRERDLEYRAMAEAQERERLAHDELKSLQAIVDQLQAENEKLAHDKEQVLAQAGPLEKEVLEMDQKAEFQHNELVAARAKIQQQVESMKATALERDNRTQKMRQLAQDRSMKCAKLQQDVVSKVWPLKAQTEALEREVNALTFDWESLSDIIREKAEVYLDQAKKIANTNDEMARELRARGIAVEHSNA